MKNRKIFAAILAITMLASMTACSDTKTESADTTETTTTTETTIVETTVETTVEETTTEENIVVAETDVSETENAYEDEILKSFDDACSLYAQRTAEYQSMTKPKPENYGSYDEYLLAYQEYEDVYNECITLYNTCCELAEKCQEQADKNASEFADTPIYMAPEEVFLQEPKKYEPLSATKTRGEYFTYDKPIMFDLDSDGTEEKIEVYPDPDESYYLNLTINGKTIEAGMDPDSEFPVKEILICDIDESDKFHEIAICGGMFGNGVSSSFFRYENGELYDIGGVGDCIDGSYECPFHLIDSLGESLKINGDGTISAAKRLELFQSWTAYATYKYDSETKTLTDVTTMYYPYGEELMNDYEAVSSKIYIDHWEPSYTTKTINLYSENDKNSKIVEFEPQKFVATATDDKNWVYLVGENGVSGWFYCEGYISYDDEIFKNVIMYG